MKYLLSVILTLCFISQLDTAIAGRRDKRDADPKKEVHYDEDKHRCVNLDGEIGWRKVYKIADCTDFRGKKVNWLFKWRLYWSKNIRGSNWSDTEYSKLRLKSKKLEGSSFVKSVLHETKFDRSDISFSDFTEAELDKARMKRIIAEGVQFNKANLHGSIATGSRFSWSDFSDSFLHAVDFSSSVGSLVKFERADILNAIFRECEFVQASFLSASIKNSDFRNCNLEKTNLNGADFTNSDLRGIKLKEVTVIEAVFHNTDLRGADLSNVDLSTALMRFAKFNDNTILPEGIDKETAVNDLGMVYAE